jgi:hypothetical protein
LKSLQSSTRLGQYGTRTKKLRGIRRNRNLKRYLKHQDSGLDIPAHLLKTCGYFFFFGHSFHI